MQKYASTTAVPVEKTRHEIEQVLKKWGATRFMYYSSQESAVVAFEYQQLTARLMIKIPDRNDPSVIFTKSKQHIRSLPEQEKVYGQVVRSRWRAMLLMIKAKLTAIEQEVATFEQEFLPYLVLPDGRTVSDGLMPQIYRALEQGEQFPMLPPGRD